MVRNKFAGVEIRSSFACIFALILLLSFSAFAQKPKTAAKTPAKKVIAATTNKTVARSSNSPKVTQIDAAALRNLLKTSRTNAKPLLVNFWATWCDPCREEFPDLVKIDAEYRNKIDFVTVSIDDLAEINREVPEFLTEMKATMPAYLLKTADEETAIASVAKDWKGGMPFTILFDREGKAVFTRQGKVDAAALKNALDKLVAGNGAKPAP